MAWTTLVEAGSLDELNAAIPAIGKLPSKLPNKLPNKLPSKLPNKLPNKLPKWTKLKLRVKLPIGSLAGIVLQGSCCYSNGCPIFVRG